MIDTLRQYVVLFRHKISLEVMIIFAKGSKNKWALFMLVLAGILAGGFIGMYLGELPFMGWLNLGASFGIDPPFALNLGIIAVSLGFNIRFTVAGIIGMVISVILYRKL